MTWSGTATAGVAREGGADAGKPGVAAMVKLLDAIEGIDADTAGDIVDGLIEELSTDEAVEEIAEIREFLTELRANSNSALAGDTLKAALKDITAAEAMLDLIAGSAAVETGDFDTYAEVNATVVGAVALDNGVTLSAAMSIDAGRGYDFADDDGFDATKTNGVALDYVKIDAGAAGILTFAPDDIEHLVDDDDDEAADVLYTNDFGVASFSFALDVDKDTNKAPSKAKFAFVDAASLTTDELSELTEEGSLFDFGELGFLSYTPAVAADVQWSAKIEAPIGDVATIYAAFDEEKGNAFGGTYTIEGIELSFDSKLEALEAELKEDRSNTIGASYTAGGLTVGGEWNSIEDGNQWAVNAAFEADAFSIAASTNEGEEWEVTGAYALTDAASAVAGVNYTEDAFAGISFTF